MIDFEDSNTYEQRLEAKIDALERELQTALTHNESAVMQIYRTTAVPATPAITTSKVSWQASQTESSKARAALKREGFKVETQTVDVPTAKGPLIKWLNENVTS